MASVIRECALVLLTGVIVSGSVALVRGVPKRKVQTAFCEAPVAQAPRVAWIKPQEAARYVHAPGAAFIDTRSDAAFANGHITGAQRVAPTLLAQRGEQLSAFARFEVVIVYGDTEGNCQSSRQGAEALASHINAKVSVLEGGFDAWLQAGLPAESGR